MSEGMICKNYTCMDAQILSNHRVINLQGKKNAKCTVRWRITYLLHFLQYYLKFRMQLKKHMIPLPPILLHKLFYISKFAETTSIL